MLSLSLARISRLHSMWHSVSKVKEGEREIHLQIDSFDVMMKFVKLHRRCVSNVLCEETRVDSGGWKRS